MANSYPGVRYRSVPKQSLDSDDTSLGEFQDTLKPIGTQIWRLPYRAIIALIPIGLLLLSFFLPVYRSCKNNFHIMDTKEMDEPVDPRCTASPAPPLIPLFVTVATLDLVSALLFVLTTFKYARRFTQLLRSLIGLAFFIVVHTYARQNTIEAFANGQSSSVGPAAYIIIFTGLFLQAIEASSAMIGVNSNKN